MFRTMFAALIIMAAPLFAAEVGDDGLHEASWIEETFKDLPEDHEEATAQGKTLMVIIEQRGCIYCTKMHEEVFPDPEIAAALNDDFLSFRLTCSAMWR